MYVYDISVCVHIHIAYSMCMYIHIYIPPTHPGTHLKGGLLDVKLNGLVEVLRIRAAREHTLELGMLPRIRRVIHHRQRRVVCLVILHVEEAQRGPVFVPLALANDCRSCVRICTFIPVKQVN